MLNATRTYRGLTLLIVSLSLSACQDQISDASQEREAAANAGTRSSAGPMTGAFLPVETEEKMVGQFSAAARRSHGRVLVTGAMERAWDPSLLPGSTIHQSPGQV